MKRTLAVVALLLVAGCGSGGHGGRPTLVVSAASSLRNAFAAYGSAFGPAQVRLSFGGSDDLAAQIRAGAPVDVYAAANTKLPDQLYADGRVDRPLAFTANRLVLAVPAHSKLRSLADAAALGLKLAIGASSVPVGEYTHHVLLGLPAGERAHILANVKSEEPDVAGIVGKLTQGAVDAGFVYATDVTAAKGALRAIPLPAKLQPVVVYEAAVVKGTKHAAQARAFVAGLRSGAGRRALRSAGFLPVPR